MAASISDDDHRLIYEVLSELGRDADPVAVAAQVRNLERGLPAEDEFTAICAWLGKTELIHKLDQQQCPRSSTVRFQVPDLLAHFTGAGTFLIEVKSKKTAKLSFTPEYLGRLQSYADMLRLPLLIAWKHHGLWTLFDTRHLRKARKNLNISFNTAITENLLGLLAGDVAYKIAPGAGMSFRFRKEKLLNTSREAGTTSENWLTRVDQVNFSVAGEERCDRLSPDVKTLFTTWDLQEHQTHTDEHIEVAFRAGTEGMMFGHMALVHLLNWTQPAGVPINWRHAIRRDTVVASMTNFAAALEAGLAQKVVHLILHQQPKTRPDFLQDRGDRVGPKIQG
jgi:Holliday junction resolvase